MKYLLFQLQNDSILEEDYELSTKLVIPKDNILERVETSSIEILEQHLGRMEKREKKEKKAYSQLNDKDVDWLIKRCRECK